MSFICTHQEEMPLSLHEQLVIAGVDIKKPDLTHQRISRNEIVPELLDIFPERAKGQGLPPHLENLNMWLFPEGVKIYNERFECLNAKEEEQGTRSQKSQEDDEYDLAESMKFRGAPEEKKSINSKEALFHFVMTDDKYIKRFCTCLLFYEKCYIPHETTIRKKRLSRSLPKLTIESLLKNPMVIDPEIDLIYVPKAVCLISRLPVFDLQMQFLVHIYRAFVLSKRENKEKVFRISAEASAKPGRSTFPSPETADKLNRRSVQIPSSPSSATQSVKETELMEFYVSALFSLMSLGEEASEKAFMKLGSKGEELFRFRLNTTTGLNLMNFSFKSLIKKLSMDNILKVVKHIILERQIVFFCSEPGEIANITESLLYLIAPLTWGCIYIPFMPLDMWETLDAMMPFIVGMDKKYKEFIKENISLNDKIIVDLDFNIVEGTDTVKLPTLAKNYLITRLNSVLIQRIEYKKAEARSQSLFWAEAVLRTKQIFNNFFLGLVNNFLPFYKYSQGEELILCSASEIFSFEGYIKLFPEEDKAFYREFASKTMLFSKFIEDCARILHSEKKRKQVDSEGITNEEELFMYQLRKLSKRSGMDSGGKGYIDIWGDQDILKIIEKEQNNQIHRALLRFQSPEEIDLSPYLIKYLESIEGSLLGQDSSIHKPSKDSFIKKIEKWFLSDNKLNFVKTDAYGRLQINVSLQALPKLEHKKIKNLLTMDTLQSKCQNKCNYSTAIMEDSGEMPGRGTPDTPNNEIIKSIGSDQHETPKIMRSVETDLGSKKMSGDHLEKYQEGNDEEGSVIVESLDNNGRKSIRNYFAYYHAIKRNVVYGDLKSIEKNHSVILSRPRPYQVTRDSLTPTLQSRPIFRSPAFPYSPSFREGSFVSTGKARAEFNPGEGDNQSFTEILRSNTITELSMLNNPKKALNFEEINPMKKQKENKTQEKKSSPSAWDF